MDWKERQAARLGIGPVVVSLVVYGALLLLLGFVSAQLALSSWIEVSTHGYQSSHVGDNRWIFNQTFLRPISAIYLFILIIMVAGTTAESLDQERKRGTWLVLLSTPLTAREILRAKEGAATRRVRPFIVILVLAWTAGVGVGTLHPLGWVAGLALLVASLQFARSLGSYSAVRAGGTSPGVNTAAIVVVFGFLLAPLPTVLTKALPWLPLAALSPPFECLVTLMTWDEVASILGKGPFGGLTILGIKEQPTGAIWLLVTAILGPFTLIGLSRWLDRQVDRRWDASVDRPTRSSGIP